MACDGYEHGTTVEVAGKLNRSLKLEKRGTLEPDLPGSSFPHFRDSEPGLETISKVRFKGAVGFVSQVLRTEHVLIVRYPGFLVSADAHAFHQNFDTTQNNILWIMKEERISPKVLLRQKGFESTADSFERLTLGGRGARRTSPDFKFRVGEVLIDMCRQRSGVEYS